MKKIVLAAVVSAVFAGLTVPASAGATYTGTIQYGNPTRSTNPAEDDTTMLVKGQSETDAACNPTDGDNGWDGIWFEIDPLDLNKNATLTIPDGRHDADAAFYTADCTYIPYTGMGRNFIAAGRAPWVTNAETGKIPADAAYLYVHGFFGKDIAFTFAIAN